MPTFVAGLVCGCLVALSTPVLALTITPTDDAMTLTTALFGSDTAPIRHHDRTLWRWRRRPVDAERLANI